MRKSLSEASMTEVNDFTFDATGFCVRQLHILFNELSPLKRKRLCSGPV